MSLQAIALPILAFIIGLASLFVDPKNSGRRSVMATIILALIASCGVAIYSNWREGERADTRERRVDTLLSTLAAFRRETSEGIAGVIEKMSAWGFVGTEVTLQTAESLLASKSKRVRWVASVIIKTTGS